MIVDAVRAHRAQQFRSVIALGTLSLSLTRHVIQRQFNNGLSVFAVRRVMDILGFSVSKPLYLAWQQYPLLVRTAQAEICPAISAKAGPAGPTIYSCDESRIHSKYPTDTTWVPQSQTPVVQPTGQRSPQNMMSAVCR